MSLVSKDSVIQACADAYKQGTNVSSVKVGELANKILEALTLGGAHNNVVIGEFTPSSVNGDFTVEHKMGSTPRFVFGWINENVPSGYIAIAFVKVNYTTGSTNTVFYNNTSNALSSVVSTVSTEDNEVTFTVPAMPWGIGIIPAYKFKYIAII